MNTVIRLVGSVSRKVVTAVGEKVLLLLGSFTSEAQRLALPLSYQPQFS